MTNKNGIKKVAVIGLGAQALNDHVPATLNSPDTKLVAVVETDKNKLKFFLSNNADVMGYESVDDLINNETIDFAILAVPHFLHFEITKKLIENNIHVLKEKPFSSSLYEAIKIKELAKKNNIQIMTTLQRRFNPIYSTFFQFIDKIGTPFFVDLAYTFYTDSPNCGWRGSVKKSGGGCVIDMGYHLIDLLIWYFGLPDFVFSEMSFFAKENIKYKTEDTAKILFSYKDQKLFGSMLISRVIFPKQEYIYIYGTRGTIKIEGGKITRYLPSGEVQESLSRDQKWPSAAQDQIEYFSKVINKEKINISSPSFHINHLSFIDSIYESKKLKKYIKIKNKHEQNK